MIACVVVSRQALHGTEASLNQLLEVLSGFSPAVEWTEAPSVAVSYLDLGSLPEPFASAQAVGQAVREAHLTPAIGLAGGKFPAYVAAVSAEPNEALIIAPGYEARFLAPFPVDLLPLNEDTARRLSLLGLHTLGQLAGLPAGAVLNQLGASGRLLHQLARGRDNRPVVGRCPEAVEVATRQLEGPVAERAILEAVFQSMTVELADRLRADGLAARTVWLTLHLDDRTACRQQLVLRHPTGTPERLARVLTELLAQARLRSGVVELEVGLVDLVPAVGQQLDLFAHGLEQGSRLREALKDLVARYGPECFYRISLPNPEARLPERRFRLERIDRP